MFKSECPTFRSEGLNLNVLLLGGVVKAETLIYWGFKTECPTFRSEGLNLNVLLLGEGS